MTPYQAGAEAESGSFMQKDPIRVYQTLFFSLRSSAPSAIPVLLLILPCFSINHLPNHPFTQFPDSRAFA